jgi:hypothetical protein
MTADQDCNICNELWARRETQLSAALGRQDIRSAVLSSSRAYAVIPSLGPLVVGHSLVVTTNHHSSVFGSISSHQQVEELSNHLVQFSRLISSLDNAEVLCFEHGAAEGRLGRTLCSTCHAHLHLVPVATTICDRIIHRFESGWTPLKRLQDFRMAASRYAEHLAVMRLDSAGSLCSGWIGNAEALPSQFMRQVLAEELGLEEWDWKVSPNRSILERTLDLGYSVNTSILDGTQPFPSTLGPRA